MHPEKIRELYIYFSQSESVQSEETFIEMAIETVKNSLRKPLTTHEPSLELLAAALANLYRTKAIANHDKITCTYAGSISQNTNAEQQVALAKEIVSEYRALASPLLKDTEFFFLPCPYHRKEDDYLAGNNNADNEN